ncbi:uncharacterized protein BDW47DRAFT_105110 [Aspergillus candidus]|uniref:F-box domain-containing protein n=1 Tax=Aspergillus candidus TaxID=41067 RepID=A0A2I2FCB9_ASPCN|nr:hypothetical protein BDW47DRAFT_105110 [Aspergillus candidus]PLB38275.1 hypothetical protein BDW47DRAFT_105110 [Aspergillus candidus]
MGLHVIGRFRDAIHRVKKYGKRQRKLTLRQPDDHQQQSIWERLPDSVLVEIASHCNLLEIYSLLLTSRLVSRRIRKRECAIAQAWLDRRRRHYHHVVNPMGVSPGDDLTFIADLFPPPPPTYTNDGDAPDDRPDYTFGYLADLTRCWTTCIRLSYYLADHVVQQHLQTDPDVQLVWSSSKTEKELVYSRGVGMLQARLLAPITHLAFFLESTASAADNATTITPRIIKTQQSILQQPPFTDTQTLLATHHTMTLLCASARRLMAPDIASPSVNNWLSLLLTTSTLERLLDLFRAATTDNTNPPPSHRTYPSSSPSSSSFSFSFPSPSLSSPLASAVSALSSHHHHTTKLKHSSTISIPSSSWTPRREFLWRMRDDWAEFVALSSPTVPDPSSPRGQSRADRRERLSLALPDLQGVWFGAAQKEMVRRGIIPHESEESVHILHGSGVRLGCVFCVDMGS